MWFYGQIYFERFVFVLKEKLNIMKVQTEPKHARRIKIHSIMLSPDEYQFGKKNHLTHLQAIKETTNNNWSSTMIVKTLNLWIGGPYLSLTICHHSSRTENLHTENESPDDNNFEFLTLAQGLAADMTPQPLYFSLSNFWLII